MLKSTKSLMEMTALADKINAVNKPDMTPEQRTEMEGWQKRSLEAGTEYRSAIVAEEAETAAARDKFGIVDGEAAEIRQIRSRVSIAGYAAAALEERQADGAEAEYNAALKVKPNEFPLSLLAPPEVRAATDIDTTVMPRPWLDRLFAESMAAMVGISLVPVNPGVASYPTIDTIPSGAQRAKTQETDIGTWSATVQEGKPKGHSSHVVFSEEDELRIPGLGDALVRNLRGALAESIDVAIFVGDDAGTGSDADITGLQTATGVEEITISQANKVKGQQTLAKFASLIDGKHATSPAGIRMVSSVGANILWMSTVINSAADNMSMAQFLQASGFTWETRDGIDANTGNGKFGGFMGRSRGLAGAGVAPVWLNAKLTRDDITSARKREIKLTLTTFWDFVLVRPANFSRLKFVT